MIDKYGLYVQADGDGGDAPHRTGIALAYFNLRGFNDVVTLSLAASAAKNLRDPDGQWFRHPDVWNDPKDFSRDQASRLMLGFAANRLTEKFAKEYYSNLLFKNFGRHPNGDVVGFGELGVMIRLFNLWFLWPLLLVLDLRFIVDVWTRSPWDGGLLFIPDLCWSKWTFNTPVRNIGAWMAKRDPKLEQEMLFNCSLEKNGCVELQRMIKWFMEEGL